MKGSINIKLVAYRAIVTDMSCLPFQFRRDCSIRVEANLFTASPLISLAICSGAMQIWQFWLLKNLTIIQKLLLFTKVSGETFFIFIGVSGEGLPPLPACPSHRGYSLRSGLLQNHSKIPQSLVCSCISLFKFDWNKSDLTIVLLAQWIRVVIALLLAWMPRPLAGHRKGAGSGCVVRVPKLGSTPGAAGKRKPDNVRIVGECGLRVPGNVDSWS